MLTKKQLEMLLTPLCVHSSKNCSYNFTVGKMPNGNTVYEKKAWFLIMVPTLLFVQVR